MIEMTGEEMIEFIEKELPIIFIKQPHLRPIVFRLFMKAFPQKRQEIEKLFGHDKTLFPEKKGDTDCDASTDKL